MNVFFNFLHSIHSDDYLLLVVVEVHTVGLAPPSLPSFQTPFSYTRVHLIRSAWRGSKQVCVVFHLKPIIDNGRLSKISTDVVKKKKKREKFKRFRRFSSTVGASGIWKGKQYEYAISCQRGISGAIFSSRLSLLRYNVLQMTGLRRRVGVAHKQIFLQLLFSHERGHVIPLVIFQRSLFQLVRDFFSQCEAEARLMLDNQRFQLRKVTDATSPPSSIKTLFVVRCLNLWQRCLGKKEENRER